jgi:hypothetical protein
LRLAVDAGVVLSFRGGEVTRMSDIGNLAQRVHLLERENRYWRVAAVLAMAALAALLLMGQTSSPQPAKVIEAEEFRVVDSAGNTRGQLGLSGEETVLWLTDAQPSPPRARVRLSVKKDGSASLGVDSRTDPRTLAAGRSNPGFTVLAFPDGTASFYLTGLASAGLAGRASLDGKASLQIHDERGAFLPGTARLVLGTTALERTQTGVIEQRPLNSLVLYGQDGKVVWKAQ